MAAVNEKDEDVVRLEERTKGLERSDKAHFFMELILFLGVLALALMLVSGCRINTPSPNVDDFVEERGKEEEKEKEWIYSETTAIPDITFTVGDDGKSVNVLINGEVYKTIRTSEDKVLIMKERKTVSAVFEEAKITLYADGTTLLGTFDYQ